MEFVEGNNLRRGKRLLPAVSSKGSNEGLRNSAEKKLLEVASSPEMRLTPQAQR